MQILRNPIHEHARIGFNRRNYFGSLRGNGTDVYIPDVLLEAPVFRKSVWGFRDNKFPLWGISRRACLASPSTHLSSSLLSPFPYPRRPLSSRAFFHARQKSSGRMGGFNFMEMVSIAWLDELERQRRKLWSLGQIRCSATEFNSTLSPMNFYACAV